MTFIPVEPQSTWQKFKESLIYAFFTKNGHRFSLNISCSSVQGVVMAQINSLLNAFVVVVVLVAALAWVGTPAPPRPLPNDAHFVSQIQQPGTVLVKFGAEWCPPCRMIEKELDTLARMPSEHVSIVKIDIDKNQELARHYQVSSIPHLFLFQDGKEVGSVRGYRNCEQLKVWIAKSN